MRYVPALLAAMIAAAASESLLVGILVFFVAGTRIEFVPDFGFEMT